jgi:hypothetical protein
MEHKRESNSHKGEARKCKHCQKEFIPRRRTKMHCSGTCRHSQWLERKSRRDLLKPKRKGASFSDIMSHLFTGVIQSFGKSGVTAKKPVSRPEVPVQRKTILIICRKKEKAGLFKRLLKLFW